MRFVGIDPGSRELGWVFLDERNIIDAGVIVAKNRDNLDARFVELHDALDLIFKKAADLGIYNAIMERYVSHRRLGLDAMKGVMAIVRMTAYRHGVHVRDIPPTTIKKTIAGDGGADKDTIARAVYEKYKTTFDRLRNNDHITDAASIGMMGFVIARKEEKDLSSVVKHINKTDGYVTSRMLVMANVCKNIRIAESALRVMKKRYEYEVRNRKHYFVIPLTEKESINY